MPLSMWFCFQRCLRGTWGVQGSPSCLMRYHFLLTNRLWQVNPTTGQPQPFAAWALLGVGWAPHCSKSQGRLRLHRTDTPSPPRHGGCGVASPSPLAWGHGRHRGKGGRVWESRRWGHKGHLAVRTLPPYFLLLGFRTCLPPSHAPTQPAGIYTSGAGGTPLRYRLKLGVSLPRFPSTDAPAARSSARGARTRGGLSPASPGTPGTYAAVTSRRPRPSCSFRFPFRACAAPIVLAFRWDPAKEEGGVN
jgi:hypothetical protein